MFSVCVCVTLPVVDHVQVTRWHRKKKPRPDSIQFGITEIGEKSKRDRLFCPRWHGDCLFTVGALETLNA